MTRVGFVGAGRLARALAPALQAAGYEVVAVASRSAASARALAAELAAAPRSSGIAGSTVPARGPILAESAQAVAEAADLVFLTVPDSLVPEVADGVRWRTDMAVVHCSGAAGLEPLAAAQAHGAETGVFHPLQTFAQPDTPLAGAAIAIQASAGLLPALETMAAALGCRPIRMPAGLEAVYHASAAMASNYLVALMAEAAALWQPLGYSEREALEALVPLARTTLANVERLGSAAALTGPIARGDAATIRKHVQALRQHAPGTLPVYRELGLETLSLAALSPNVSAEIHAILTGASKETTPCA